MTKHKMRRFYLGRGIYAYSICTKCGLYWQPSGALFRHEYKYQDGKGRWVQVGWSDRRKGLEQISRCEGDSDGN